MGLEPTRHCWHKILSLACLPIPALPHDSYFSEFFIPHRRCKSYIITIGLICQQLFLKNFQKIQIIMFFEII